MGSRELKKLATRQGLIDAAERLFVERGVEATTMEDIARAAGTSRTSVFNYFGYKEKILCEIGARYVAEVAGAAPPPDRPDQLPAATFGQATRALAGLAARQPAVIAAVARETTHPDPERRRVAEETMGYPRLIRDMLDRYASVGLLRNPRHKATYARQLVDLISGTLVRAGGEFPADRLRDELDRAFELFTLGALAAPGADGQQA